MFALSLLFFLAFVCSTLLQAHDLVSISLLIASGLLHFFFFIKEKTHYRPRLGTCLLIALCMRLPSFWSDPFKEDDYYRYLWDGLVTSHFANAMIISPQEVIEGITYDDTPERMKLVKERQGFLESGSRKELLEKINYPESPTIYGPSAQIFLALQSLPMRLLAKSFPELKISLNLRIRFLQLCFILCELVAICVFFRLAQHFHVPLMYLMCFATHPILLKEISYSLHIDILAVTFTLASTLAIIKNKTLLSALLLAIAAGVKSYSIFLAPFMLLFLKSRRIPWLLLFGATLSALYAPFLMSGGSEIFSGSRYFASIWSMNDFLTSLIREILYHSTTYSSHEIEIPPIGFIEIAKYQHWARYTGFAMYCLCVAFLIYRRRKQWGDDWTLLRSMGEVLFLIYLFSPVQNPWYLVWSLPFLVLTSNHFCLLFCAMAQFYLVNFVYDKTNLLFHPPQWWVMTHYGLWLVMALIIYRFKMAPLGPRNFST